MNIVTLDDLSRAIANRVGVDIEEARRDAGFVLDIFGFDDRVIDNVLDPEDRQLFYILEEEGMLATEREETTLYDGREWRTHYWQLKKETILNFADEINKPTRTKILEKNEPVHTVEETEDEDIYNQLEEDMWTTRKIDT
jgi:hypothetical protein